MASSIADTTTSGSMCFSRLSISICWYSKFAILLPRIPTLKLHHQIRLANHLNRQLNGPRFLALQLQTDSPVPKSRQPPFKKLCLAHRLTGRNFRQSPLEPQEIRRLVQRPVHPRRADLQDVSRPGYRFLDIQDHAQLLADALTVRVADLRIGVLRRRLQRFASIADLPRRLRNPV